MRTSAPLAVALLACAVAASAAGAQGRPLAGEQRPTRVAAWRGGVVWSRYDPAIDAYRLVLSRDGGPPEMLPVAPRPAPFDVDLGTARGGATYAVFSRDGDLRRLSIATGREERLATLSSMWEERDPTIFRGDIAFVRRELGRGGRPMTTIRIGATTRASRRTRVVVRGHALAEPELGAGQLAYLAEGSDGTRALRVRTLRTGADRRVLEVPAGATLTGPALTETARSFVALRATGGRAEVVQHRIASRTLAVAHGDPRWVSTGWAGGGLGLVAATGAEPDGRCEAPGACRVEVTGPLRWRVRG